MNVFSRKNGQKVLAALSGNPHSVAFPFLTMSCLLYLKKNKQIVEFLRMKLNPKFNQMIYLILSDENVYSPKETDKTKQSRICMNLIEFSLTVCENHSPSMKQCLLVLNDLEGRNVTRLKSQLERLVLPMLFRSDPAVFDGKFRELLMMIAKNAPISTKNFSNDIKMTHSPPNFNAEKQKIVLDAMVELVSDP